MKNGTFMKKGVIVAITNTTIDGRKVEEGEAVLVKFVCFEGSGDESWMVRFKGEPGATYRRKVLMWAYCDALQGKEKKGKKS